MKWLSLVFLASLLAGTIATHSVEALGEGHREPTCSDIYSDAFFECREKAQDSSMACSRETSSDKARECHGRISEKWMICQSQERAELRQCERRAKAVQEEKTGH